MHLKFKKITAKNHTPYRWLEVELENGMTVIRGINIDEFSSNGSGKSTIFEILFWIITGMLLRDKLQPVSNKQKEPVFDVLWLDADTIPYRIERTRKGVNSGHVDFFQGDNKLTLGTNTLTQELIYKTLNINAEMLIATTLFDGSNHTSFATMGDKKQKELFVKILNLDFWEKCHNRRKEVSKTLVDNRAVESRRYQEHIAKLKETQLNFKTQTEKKEDHQKSKPLQANYVPMGVKKLETDLKLAAKEKEDKTIQSELLQASEFAANQVLNDMKDVEAELRLFSSQKSELKKNLKQAEDKINALNDSKCVECKQTVDVTKEQIEVATGKFLSLERKLKALQIKIDEQEAKVKLLRPGIKDHDWDAISKLKRTIVELDFEVTKITRSLKEIAKLSKKYDQDLAVHTSKQETLKENIIELETRGKELYTAALKSKTEVTKLSAEIVQEDYLMKMYGRTGIQTSLIRSIEAPLNEVLSGYMKTFGFKYSEIQLSTFKELKNGEIRDQISVTLMEGSIKRAFTTFSRGEKRRLDLIFFLALREMLSARISTNLLILDEVINNLDPSGVSGLKEILDSKLKGSSIWIAIPADHFEWSCQHNWTVTKRRKVACLSIT